MNIRFSPTPFGTVHATATGPAGQVSQLKGKVTRQAKANGLGEQVTRRSHVIGDTATVFTVYRKV